MLLMKSSDVCNRHMHTNRKLAAAAREKGKHSSGGIFYTAAISITAHDFAGEDVT